MKFCFKQYSKNYIIYPRNNKKWVADKNLTKSDITALEEGKDWIGNYTLLIKDENTKASNHAWYQEEPDYEEKDKRSKVYIYSRGDLKIHETLLKEAGVDCDTKGGVKNYKSYGKFTANTISQLSEIYSKLMIECLSFSRFDQKP